MTGALLCLESSGNLCSVAVSGFDRETYLQSEPGQNRIPDRKSTRLNSSHII